MKSSKLSSLRLTLCLLATCFVACKEKVPESTNETPNSALVIPKGALVTGVSLSGPLAGRKMYLMPQNMAPNNCWIDSQAWNGSELFFGISSINWTKLNQQSVISYDSSCSPSPAFQTQTSPGVTGNFNMFRAIISGGSWVISSLPLNLGLTVSAAAPKLSGSSLFFVKYEKGASAFGNIYISNRTADNAYSTPTAFPLNSAGCNEDNPMPYWSGTKVIFESSRSNSAGTSCGSIQKLWYSSFDGSSWSAPSALSGSFTAASNSTTQPFLDENMTNLYWTAAGTDCAGTVTTCIKTASGSGTSFAGVPSQIITPVTPGSGWAGGGMVGLIGQYTESNGNAFVACGIVRDIDPSSSTTGLIFNRYAIQIQTCVIPL